jgi:hypothetical protein
VGTLQQETPVQPSSVDRFLTPDDRLREVAAILATDLQTPRRPSRSGCRFS